MIEEIRCTPPKFTGIEKATQVVTDEKYPTIEQYLTSKIEYPDEAVRSRDEGTEVVSFIVTSSGVIADINIVNSVSKEIDEAVIHALKTTNGMWIPGNNNEKPVAMEKEVSMVFRFSDFAHNDFILMTRKHYTHGSEMLFMKQNPKKALHYFDKGVILLPNEKSLLVLRGLTRFELGDKKGAVIDWTRVKTLGGLESIDYLNNYANLKGYAELTTILAK
jgi:TonB family protein